FVDGLNKVNNKSSFIFSTSAVQGEYKVLISKLFDVPFFKLNIVISECSDINFRLFGVVCSV
ncbi:MAG: hypothetical protein J7M14_02995, partial [Planctomycetes bacterium]|nr:hypothetical protein [Planctomycetota bacterium]